MPSQDFHVSLARKIYPDYFNEAFTPPGRYRYKMEGIDSVRIIHANPPRENVNHHFSVEITYKRMMEKEKRKGDWLPMEGSKPKIVTPEMVVVERDEVARNFYELMEGMKLFFRANVLVLGKYSGEERVTRKGIKDALRCNDIWLFFKDEL